MGAPNNSTKLFGPQQAFCSRVKSCCFVLAQRAHCGSQDKGLAKQNSVLITMGCGEACPLVPGLEREDWPLSDPKGRSLESGRAIRDEIKLRVQDLLARRRITTR